jgi:hypothetical protein
MFINLGIKEAFFADGGDVLQMDLRKYFVLE